MTEDTMPEGFYYRADDDTMPHRKLVRFHYEGRPQGFTDDDEAAARLAAHIQLWRAARHYEADMVVFFRETIGLDPGHRARTLCVITGILAKTI